MPICGASSGAVRAGEGAARRAICRSGSATHRPTSAAADAQAAARASWVASTRTGDGAHRRAPGDRGDEPDEQDERAGQRGPPRGHRGGPRPHGEGQQQAKHRGGAETVGAEVGGEPLARAPPEVPVNRRVLVRRVADEPEPAAQDRVHRITARDLQRPDEPRPRAAGHHPPHHTPADGRRRARRGRDGEGGHVAVDGIGVEERLLEARSAQADTHRDRDGAREGETAEGPESRRPEQRPPRRSEQDVDEQRHEHQVGHRQHGRKGPALLGEEQAQREPRPQHRVPPRADRGRGQREARDLQREGMAHHQRGHDRGGHYPVAGRRPSPDVSVSATGHVTSRAHHAWPARCWTRSRSLRGRRGPRPAGPGRGDRGGAPPLPGIDPHGVIEADGRVDPAHPPGALDVHRADVRPVHDAVAGGPRATAEIQVLAVEEEPLVQARSDALEQGPPDHQEGRRAAVDVARPIGILVRQGVGAETTAPGKEPIQAQLAREARQEIRFAPPAGVIDVAVESQQLAGHDADGRIVEGRDRAMKRGRLHEDVGIQQGDVVGVRRQVPQR